MSLFSKVVSFAFLASTLVGGPPAGRHVRPVRLPAGSGMRHTASTRVRELVSPGIIGEIRNFRRDRLPVVQL
jgi:hypothetical protein